FTGVFENLSVDRAGEIGRYIVAEYTAGGAKRLAAEGRAPALVPPTHEPSAVDAAPAELQAVDEGAESFLPAEGFDQVEAELDAVDLIYSEFKSAMTQKVV